MTASAPPTLGSKRSTAAFAKWLRKGGAEVRDPTSEYEVVRFRCGGVLLIIYRNAKGSVTNLTGVARECWDAFAAGEPFPYPPSEAREVLTPDRVSADPDAIGRVMTVVGPITIADVMAAVPCTQRAALKMLLGAEAGGRLARSTPTRHTPLRWSETPAGVDREGGRHG